MVIQSKGLKLSTITENFPLVEGVLPSGVSVQIVKGVAEVGE